MMKFKRIVFAGTPQFAASILQDLLHNDWPITAVYTQPDRPAGRGRKLQASAVKQLALQHQLPVYQPTSLRVDSAQEDLRQIQPDLMIVVAYGLILPHAVLAIPQYGCVNVHASLLPRWRGAAPIQRAILAGDKQSGVSIMQMDQGLDTGPVYQMASLPITETMTSQQLHDELVVLGASTLQKTLQALQTENITPVIQASNGVTYADKINKAEGEISWQDSALEIVNKIRAFNPWPVAFTHLNQQRLRIWQASLATKTTALPGTIVSVTDDYISVAATDGAVNLQIIQLAGGKAISVRDVLNANADFFQPGMIFS